MKRGSEKVSEAKIINNLSLNHYECILDIAKNGDTFYIVSPYLMESFDTIFCELRETSITRTHLVTTLKNNDMELLRKANSLYSFCTLYVENKIKFDVHVDNKLHSKIYVASKNSVFTCGMMTAGLGWCRQKAFVPPIAI